MVNSDATKVTLGNKARHILRSLVVSKENRKWSDCLCDNLEMLGRGKLVYFHFNENYLNFCRFTNLIFFRFTENIKPLTSVSWLNSNGNKSDFIPQSWEFYVLRFLQWIYKRVWSSFHRVLSNSSRSSLTVCCVHVMPELCNKSIPTCK